MKTETITNRIDNNITSLLRSLSVKDCIRQLEEIKNRFELRLIQNIAEEFKMSTRSKYLHIYITHTNKRIQQLKHIAYNVDFEHLLFKERLEDVNVQPNKYSQKYRQLLRTIN